MRTTLAVILGVLLPAGLLAIEPDEAKRPYIHDPRLDVQPSLVRLESGAAAEKPELQKLLAGPPESWEVFWDTRNDRPHLIQGSGIPFVPGRGNRLRREGPLALADVEALARRFFEAHADLFGVRSEELALVPERSGNFGDEGQLWFVEFEQRFRGIPVEGAGVFLRLNHGNAVQLGAERVDRFELDTEPALPREQALAKALAAAGFDERMEALVEPGRLVIVPLLPEGQRPGELHDGPAGRGYDHALVWEILFRRPGDAASYRALVDAHDGRVLELADQNGYGSLQGGVYPGTYLNAEQPIYFPNATVNVNGTNVPTGTTGAFYFNSGTVSVALDGLYFRMADTCGSISLSSTTGSLNLGTSAAGDCTTPGVGGAGNTHASRTGFYHLTNANRFALPFLPSTSWLGTKVTANMDIDLTCNAYWSSSAGTLNFYRSGGGCGNTGQIAAVFLHEWGHGLDQNTGGGDDGGTKEAVGDSIAMLYTRDPCLGEGFKTSKVCHNCTTCTGVRDLEDFSQAGTRPIASPANVANTQGIDCGRYACPFDGSKGVMGYEAHCESYISSTPMWDLGNSLRQTWGAEPGWNRLTQLWFNSMPASKNAYQLVSGGQCNPQATVNGCAASNLYQVLLAADDDDGNLSNGTPNACRIWSAFQAHGIACGSTSPACSAAGPASATVLVDQVPVTGLSGSTGSMSTYTLQVPPGTPSLVFTTAGGTGNVNLYVRYGSPPPSGGYDCYSSSSTNNERCSFTWPIAGTWYVTTSAISSFSGVTLTGAYPPPLAPGVAEPGQSSQSTDMVYAVQTFTGTTNLTVTTSGGSGNPDLYVKFGSVPSTSSYNCRSTSSGTSETCSLGNPSVGLWYVLVHPTSSFSNVTVQANVTVPVP
jgi:hypothetical protein